MKTSVNGRWSVRKACAIVAGVALAGGGLAVAGGTAAFADGPSACQPAGDSGFTAAVVAVKGQTISNRTVNATGCDVGIYVGTGVTDVIITRVTVEGANAAGILAQKTSRLTVSRSTVDGNGFQTAIPASNTNPEPGSLPQAFGISLFGVSHATLTRNTVYNNGRGGIGVMDNGAFDPGQVVGGPGAVSEQNFPVSDVTISRNTLWSNYAGCAIVVSAFNVGNTVSDVDVTRNTVKQGDHPFGPTGPDVGGIVAQSNGAGSAVSDIMISRNSVTDSGEGGVIVHAAAPASMTKNVTVTRNILSGDGWLSGPTQTMGVVVDSRLIPADLGQSNVNTVVTRNVISNEFFGIWAQGPNAPVTSRNDITFNAGGEAIHVQP